MPPRNKQQHDVALNEEALTSPLFFRRSTIFRTFENIPVPPTTKTSKGEETGGLQFFPKLPLDLILEASKYFGPRDLLRLIRVNKMFRSLYLSRSSRFIWTITLTNIPNLPPCPIFLDEPEYASLIFEKHCMACCTSHNVKQDFGLCLRLCKPCLDKLVVQGRRKLETSFGKHTGITITLVPRSLDYASTTSGRNSNHPALANKTKHRYFAPEVKFASDRFLQLYGTDYKENAVKYTITFRMQQAVASGYMNLGKALFDWKASTASLLSARKHRIIAERRLQINSKMKELTWEDKYLPSIPSGYHKWDPKPMPKLLIDTDWDTILPHLEIEYQNEQARQAKCAFERSIEERFNTFKASLSESDRAGMPGWSIVKTFPCLKTPLEEFSNGLKVTEAFWENLSNQVLSDGESYRLKAEQILYRILKESEPTLKEMADISVFDVLIRASSLFIFSFNSKSEISSSRPLLCYPEILQYFYSFEYGFHEIEAHIGTASGIKDIAETVLVSLGFPLDTTSTAMSAYRGKFRCRCGHPDCQTLFDFPSLVRHIFNEQQWYNFRVNAVRPVSESKTPQGLINDHALSRLSELVSVIRETDPPTPLEEPPTNITHSRRKCKYCYKILHIHERLNTIQQAKYHMWGKHGVVFKDTDLMDGCWLKIFGPQLPSELDFNRLLQSRQYR